MKITVVPVGVSLVLAVAALSYLPGCSGDGSGGSSPVACAAAGNSGLGGGSGCGGQSGSPDASGGSTGGRICWDLGTTFSGCVAGVGGSPAAADWCAPTSRSIVCSDNSSFVYECSGTSAGCACHCLQGQQESHSCTYPAVTCGSSQQVCLAGFGDCGFPAVDTVSAPHCVADGDCPSALPHCNQVDGTCEPKPTDDTHTCWLDGFNNSVPSPTCSFETRRVGCQDGKLYQLSCSGAGPTCTCTCSIGGAPISTCDYNNGSSPCTSSLASCGFPSEVANAGGQQSCLSAAACPSSLPFCRSGFCASQSGN
jgi:hypothetical protein